MKRKILSLLLCAAMVTTILGGCAAGNQTTSSEESTNTTQSTQTEDSALESEEVTVKTATTDDVKAALEDENSIVLDARISDAYNGWQIDGAARGGHIKGAESFSADWLTCDYDEEGNLEGESREEVLNGYLENKKLTEDKNVIIYDTNGTDAAAVADYLISKGIKMSPPMMQTSGLTTTPLKWNPIQTMICCFQPAWFTKLSTAMFRRASPMLSELSL